VRGNAERVVIAIVEDDVGPDWKAHHTFVDFLARASDARIFRNQLARRFDGIENAADGRRPFGGDVCFDLLEIVYCRW
jgi:hypothetical protein